MKRLIAILLIALMILPSLIACGGNVPAVTTPSVTDNSLSDEPAVSDPAETTYPFSEAKYNGATFRVHVSGNMSNMNDFEVDESADDVINSSRFRWLTIVSEKYDVEIEYEAELAFGSAGGSGNGFQQLKKSYTAADYNYQAAMTGTYDVAQAALQGYLSDLNNIEGLDITNAWWDQKANEDMTIHGKMYYTTGDISLTDNQVTHCILFNKELAKSIEDPYQLVFNNKWTFEKMAEMVAQVSEDVNGDDKMDRYDKYGLLTWNDSMLQILASAQQRICTVNEDSEITLTVYNDTIASLFSDYNELVFTQNAINYQNGYGQNDWDPLRLAMFDESRAMFYMTLFTTVPKHRDSDVDFGILPFPKYDETQSDYGHQVSAFHGQFLCVPTFIEDEKFVADILEYLAAMGKDIMTPAYYEKTLVGTHFRDEESGEMLDIIFASRVYDIGIYYSIGGYKDMIAGLIKTPNPSFSRMYNAYKSKAQKELDALNTDYSKIGE